MTPYRSHWGFWLALALVVASFIKAHPPIAQWGQDEWIDLAMAGITWAIGKLQSSPLPGKDDV